MTVDALTGLRNRVLDEYVDGRSSRAVFRADLDAITVEIDRVVSPDAGGRLEDRAERVVAAILAESRARHADVSPARTARLDFWHRRRLERLRDEDPSKYEAEIRGEAQLEAAEPDEVRMAHPILAALSEESVVQGARNRAEAIAKRPAPEGPPAATPAFPDVAWTDDDRLPWEEFIGGVPCQSCGRPFLGDETSQREGESWSAYRDRMGPIEEEFMSRHPDHGTRWTVSGGPLHCRRCCAPHPLSPEQIREIDQILNPPAPPPAAEVPVRRCRTCHQPIEGEHVCELADLPKPLRAVVEAVLKQERAGRA